MKYFGLLFTLFCSMGLSAQEPCPVSFDYNNEALNIDIRPYTLYVDDESGLDHSVDWAKKQALRPFAEQGNARAKNHTASSLIVSWLTFTIKNKSPYDTISLYYFCGHFKNIKVFDDGDRLLADILFEDRLDNLRGTFIPLTILPGKEARYWVKITNQMIVIMPINSFLLSHSQALLYELKGLKFDKLLFLLLSITAGSLAFMALYAVFNFVQGRDKVFLYYSIYIAVSFFMVITFTNMRVSLKILPFPFWPPDLYPAIFIFYAMFISKLIALKDAFPKIWKVVVGILVILIAKQAWLVAEFATGRLFFSSNVPYLLKLIPEIIIVLLLMILTIISSNPVKKFLVPGMVSLILISLFPTASNMNFDDNSPGMALLSYPPFFMFAGITAEAFCFAMALAYRTRLMELEKLQLQETYAIQLEEQIEVRANEIEMQNKLLEEKRIRQVQMEYEQKLAETEITTLRAQLNPHFVYNCLNSIKLYMSENDSALTREYLSKFSRLMRLVLENSRCDKVILDNELEALTLYMELEAMRFKDKIDFEVLIDPDVETEFIEIPPLLIQPHVENAVWHGIMHKESKGTVIVKMQMADEHTLRVIVTDDGVGRTMAEQLKSKSATKHKSLGSKLTAERITLINKIFSTETQMQVHDLTNDEGLPAGTEVVIHIPV